eukprot:13069965-Ditylum_brightwellii.AAC.1
MKIDHKALSLQTATKETNLHLSCSTCQTTRRSLCTNPKEEKSAVYNLVVKYYEVRTPEEWLRFMDAIAQVIKGQDIQDGDAAYSLVKSLLKGDTLQVFKNKGASQDVKDGPAFTKCFAAVTEHIFPKKAYNTQKKYIRNTRKPLVLGS